MSSEIDTLKLEMRPFVKRSVTTLAGNVGGTTLVDATLVEAANFWNGCWILLRTGTYAGQLRRVTGFATPTITLDHTVGGQIIAGVQYMMMTRIPVDVIAGGGFKADLRQVLGQGADISPANPLQTEDQAISPARGTTDANGNIGGTTVIDTTRTEPNNHWNNMALLITSGAQAGQVREIITWVLATGTFTVNPAFGGQILNGVTYKILTYLPADIDVAAIEAKLGEIADPEAEAGAGLPRLLWLKNGIRRGIGTILPVNTSLYDWILTRAAPGDQMALTAAERLIVQALILSDATPFPGANIDAAISTRAVPGDAMALTAAERLIVQALILSDATPFAGADIPLIRAETDQLPNIEHETEWALACHCDEVESAAQTNLTVGTVTPTFPTGATRVRAILVASIHILNLAANTHHINFKVQGNKDGGAYSDLLDLTASAQLGLVNLDGSTDGWSAAVDCTALMDASGSTYNFRFVVQSDNAGMVRYITCFTLVLVYHM